MPTPPRRRWHLFRTGGLPGVVFVLALVSTIWLWMLNRPQPVREAAAGSGTQGVASHILGPQPQDRVGPELQPITSASGATNYLTVRSHLQ